jgi:nucleoid DNA-binding protein
MDVRPTKTRPEVNEEEIENEVEETETEEIENEAEEIDEPETEDEEEIVTEDGVEYELLPEGVSFEDGEFDRVDYVASILGTSKREAKEIIETVVDAISYETVVNGTATLPGLGKLNLVEVAERPARKGRNPHTGEEIEIPAKPAYDTIKLKLVSAGKEWAAEPYLPVQLSNGRWGYPVEEEEE